MVSRPIVVRNNFLKGVGHCKDQNTENALLNKAATLAAKKHVLLADSQLPPALVNAKTKPLSQ